MESFRIFLLLHFSSNQVRACLQSFHFHLALHCIRTVFPCCNGSKRKVLKKIKSKINGKTLFFCIFYLLQKTLILHNAKTNESASSKGTVLQDKSTNFAGLIVLLRNYSSKIFRPGLKAPFAPDLDVVVLDSDPVIARAHAGEEGESRAQVHRQQLLYTIAPSFSQNIKDLTMMNLLSHGIFSYFFTSSVFLYFCTGTVLCKLMSL